MDDHSRPTPPPLPTPASPLAVPPPLDTGFAEATVKQPEVWWPHAPPHRLDAESTFFVTASTYKKELLFAGEERLQGLHNRLLQTLQEHGWLPEAWAVFPNHYHLIVRPDRQVSDSGSDEGTPLLAGVLGRFHTQSAVEINRLDQTPGRKVWHNFWDTRLTYEKAYLARLNYVHQNPVKHGVVAVAADYPWCSAAWFERTASAAWIKTVTRFKTDRLKIPDDF